MKDIWLNSQGKLEEGCCPELMPQRLVHTGNCEEVLAILFQGCAAVVVSSFPLMAVAKAWREALSEFETELADDD